MEQLIYIEQNDKNEASMMSSGFTVEETKRRAYINALGTELGMKYLAQENINVSNVHNLHSIHNIREEFDIADIMLPNIHIDVRVVYDENLIFVPKSHFEYNITPNIYLVFKMAQELTHVEFLGFFEPKLINKNNQNDKYYFMEKEKLSHPSDLKSYVENFNGNTTEALSEEDLTSSQKLAISLIDHEISDSDKKKLLKMLTKSATLREELIEFDNFEMVSYHVATNENFEDFVSDSTNNLPVGDEFDEFETADEFDNFEETLQEDDIFNEIPENDFIDENTEEGISEDIGEDVDSAELPLDEEIIEDVDFDKTIEDLDKEDLSNEDVELTVEGIVEELPSDNAETLDSLLNDNLLEDLPEHTGDFSELEDSEELHIEETISMDSLIGESEEIIDNISLEEDVIESFESLEQPVEEENDIQETVVDELVSLEEIPVIEEEVVEDVSEEETQEEFLSLDDIDNVQEESMEDAPEAIDTLSFDELSSESEEEIIEDSEEENIAETVSLEDYTETEDFLDDLVEDASQETEEIASYENSTMISSENIVPGEISIDINQAEEVSEEDELEKLELLYSEDNDLSDVEESLEVKTNSPERGKKAIALATLVIGALAASLVFVTMNKSNNDITEQNNSNVLEKNLPKLDAPTDDIEKVVPKTTSKPKIEEVAKQAQEEVAKPKTQPIESPYIDVKKLGWSVPDYVSYNDDFKKYLQTAGRSLKLSLSSDLLLATEYAYSNQIHLDITLSKEGVLKDVKITQSSGSTQIDDIVLRTVKDTLSVVKAPAGVIVGDSIHLTLKIYL